MTPRHHLTDPPMRTLEIGPLQQIGRLEAQITRLQDVAEVGQRYIEFLDRGLGPSHPHYLSHRDIYRIAIEDLQPGDLDPVGKTR
jgi:hypothetical protein